MDTSDDLDDRARSESLKDAASVLEELLTGSFSVWADGSLYETKQLVARVRGLQIYVFANEHAPPHFHVKSPDIDAVFAIKDCAFLKGNIDDREQRLVLWWYERARPQLIAAWNASRPADCPVGPVDG